MVRRQQRALQLLGGNQNLEVDDMAFVEFAQQYGEKLKQKHAGGQDVDFCTVRSDITNPGCEVAFCRLYLNRTKTKMRWNI